MIGLSVQASRVSGAAPLAVHFDATATTHGNAAIDTFHAVTYAFDFGDQTAATWAISGKSKNTQVGSPLAAHVFDAPGSYVVTITATEGSHVSTTTVQVEVESPDAHWPAAQTVVVSPAGDFTGAPAGAEQRTSLPATYAGRRVLLHRGESYPAISLPGTADDVLIGTYGTGAKPQVASVFLGGNGDQAEWPDEITIMDLDILDGFALHVTGSRVLLYRCDLDTPSMNDAQIDIGTALGYHVDNGALPAASYYWPREIFLVENLVEGKIDGTSQPNLVCMGSFARSALLGNRMNRATQHTLRMWSANRTFVAHNAFGGEHYAESPPGIRHAIKIHSSGEAPYADNVGTSTLGISSRYIALADNTIGSTDYLGSWTVALGPQNTDPGTVEPVIDVVLENNQMIRGPYTTLDAHLLVQRGTTRGNTVLGGGAFEGDGVTVDESTSDPAMDPYCGPYFGQIL